MHFKINSQVLADSLKKIEKVVNPKHTIPILQGISMEVTQEEIILIGSDSTESFRYHIPVDGESVEVFECGKAVLPKQVCEIAKKLKTQLELKLENFNLSIKYGKKSEFTLNTFDYEEYPKLPKFNIDKPSLTFKGADFGVLIKRTAYAASDSETRPILTGVNMSLESDCMTLVATDSHRLGQIKSTKITTEEPMSLVIPAKALDKLAKTFDLQEDISVYCESNNQVVFRSGQLFFYTRVLEGNYPDTTRLMPNSFKSEMKIGRKELLDSLDRISGLASGADNGKGGVVKLFVNGAATISTHQSQIGKGQEVVEYEELNGEDNFTISFSAKYLIDALKAVESDYILFKYQGDNRPFIITPTDSEYDETQLILPVRTLT
ncbi:DNA polymerase III [Fictibacillus phosphorivorans]|uniref:Beta sliding clamp n=1 Tax=Fictibacillus phosphorivorans TaxID=1221500 RepID=A0A161TPS8_9BACL|nr:DNA polymerase III [Fictibacillus phosphorivorans]